MAWRSERIKPDRTRPSDSSISSAKYANSFGVDNHNALLFGLGNSSLAAGSLRQGVAVRIDSTPSAITLQAVGMFGPGLQTLSPAIP